MKEIKSCCVIVAHPDDETLWCGGLILLNPKIDWTIISLCRKSDADRAPKFYRVLKEYGAKGAMGDVDDGPEQKPLELEQVKDAILDILPGLEFDLIITHGPDGEYTSHRRHEEVSQAVLLLWKSQRIRSKELWLFAYEDGGGRYLPRASDNVDIYVELPENVWKKKYKIITNIYGYNAKSFEAGAAVKKEAFRRIKGV